MKDAKLNDKKLTFINGLGYLYIPIFMFLISGYFMRNYDIVFISSFFTVVTLSYLSSYYLINKSYSEIRGEKFLRKVIPLMFVISVVLAIILNTLIIL